MSINSRGQDQHNFYYTTCTLLTSLSSFLPSVFAPPLEKRKSYQTFSFNNYYWRPKALSRLLFFRLKRQILVPQQCFARFTLSYTTLCDLIIYLCVPIYFPLCCRETIIPRIIEWVSKLMVQVFPRFNPLIHKCKHSSH